MGLSEDKIASTSLVQLLQFRDKRYQVRTSLNCASDNDGMAKLEIFSRCKSHLDDADLMIALLDGSQVDDGAAWEIGYFYAGKSHEQKLIGIRTDFRRARESEGAIVNPMIEGSCDQVVRSREELMETVSHLF
ncbi:MAG: nucleoside 2-deoxyribosyltransferase [Syntrophobacteraceae bacterium]